MEPPLHFLTQHLLPTVPLGLEHSRESRETTKPYPAELHRPQTQHRAPIPHLLEWLHIQVNDPWVNHPAGKGGKGWLWLNKEGSLGLWLSLKLPKHRENPWGSSVWGGAEGPLKGGHRTPQLQSWNPRVTEAGKDLQVHRVILQSFGTTKLLKEHSRSIISYHLLLSKPWLLLQVSVGCSEGSPSLASPPQKFLWNTN